MWENTQYEKHNSIKNGLPPHTWGIPRFTKCCSRRAGITPTCVGNTRVQTESPAFRQDHPHLRGEYQGGYKCSTFSTGSPPLAWGILDDAYKAPTRLRITPTCVGNTLCCLLSLVWYEDHPHLRGEYKCCQTQLHKGSRSPPLAWGIDEWAEQGSPPLAWGIP